MKHTFHPSVLLPDLRQTEGKQFHSGKHVYQLLAEGNRELLSEAMRFFILGYFLKMTGIPSLPQRQKFPLSGLRSLLIRW